MCTDDQHKEKVKILQDILTQIKQPNIDKTVGISASTPLILDYQERSRIFLFSPAAFTLSLEEYGNLFIPSYTWINVSFPQGLRCTAVGVVNPIPVLVRSTNQDIANADPFLSQNNIPDMIASGQGYTATTGQQAVGVAGQGTYGLSIWHPSTNTKNIYIYSIQTSNGGGFAVAALNKHTADPALGTVATVTNANFNDPTSSIAGNISFSAANSPAGSTPGTQIDAPIAPQASVTQLLANNSGFFIPANTAFSLAVYMFIANSQTFCFTMKYLEF